MSRRTVLVVITDTHANNKRALMNPTVQLPEETEEGELTGDWYTPKPTKLQEYLWRLYVDGMKQVYRIARGDEVMVIHNGDECQGNKHPAHHVSARLADEILIAVANLEPWLQFPNVKHFRLAHGTQAHSFLMGSSTHLVRQMLADKHPDKDVRACYHGLIEYNGYMVDYAHHGPHPGSRSWLRGNIARLYLRDLMDREIKRGNRPPDLVVRGHYHTPVHETLTDEANGQEYVSDLYIVPSWCGMDDHAQQATRSHDSITFGMLVIEIVDGAKVKAHKLYDSLDLRKREVL